MPRKSVYVCTQSPRDIMSGLLEIMQNQSGDNHLTVTCMRAMNKYLSTNLRQSTAKFKPHESKRSTRSRLCRLCGLKIANMANHDAETQSNIAPQAGPGSDQTYFEVPQNIDHVVQAPENCCDHEDSGEPMQIDDDSDEEEQVAVALTEVSGREGIRVLVPHSVKESVTPADSNEQHPGELPQPDESAVQPQSGTMAEASPIPTKTNVQPVDIDCSSTEASDTEAEEIASKHDSNAQRQSSSFAEDIPAPFVVETPSPSHTRFQGPRNITQSFCAANNSDSPNDCSTQSPWVQNLQSPSSAVQENAVVQAEFNAALQTADVETPIAETTIAETPPIENSAEETHVTGRQSSSVSKNRPSAGRTPFAGPRNFTQSFCAPNDSGLDTSSEEPLQFPETPCPGRKLFGASQNISKSFSAPNDSDVIAEESPEIQFGSSPPVMSDTLTDQPVRKRSFRDSPPPASFYHADSSDNGSEDETEGGIKKATSKGRRKHTNKVTKKSKKDGYRSFLQMIKESLNQPFNSDETLTETDLNTSSPSGVEKDKEKDKDKVQNASFVSDKTEEDTEEETEIDPALIARSLITSNPRKDLNETVSFIETDNPLRRDRPFRQRAVSAPRNPNLPTITITNTDLDSTMTVDYQNSIEHGFGLRYKPCKARIPKVDKNALTIPKPSPRSKTTFPSRNKRRSSSPSREERSPKVHRTLSRPNQASAAQRAERARRRGSLRHLTNYPVTGDKRKREEDYNIKTTKKTRFAFGTKEWDL